MEIENETAAVKYATCRQQMILSESKIKNKKKMKTQILFIHTKDNENAYALLAYIQLCS